MFYIAWMKKEIIIGINACTHKLFHELAIHNHMPR